MVRDVLRQAYLLFLQGPHLVVSVVVEPVLVYESIPSRPLLSLKIYTDWKPENITHAKRITDKTNIVRR